MKFTLSWLKEHLETKAPLETIRDTLDQLGLVVEKVENKAEALKPFTICEVTKVSAHPNADRLRVCDVNTGNGVLQVVCGASNVYKGMKAVLARAGDVIPSTQRALKAEKVRDVPSEGMLCSGEELLLEAQSEGIIDVDAQAPLGKSYAEWRGFDDPIIEVSITPNRGDCLGVYGIARDLAAAGVGALNPLPQDRIKDGGPCPVPLKLKTPTCPYFTGRVIRGVKNGPSPEWLRKKLESIGVRPISALVDITNYFTFDRGRPLHVFDAELLKGDLVVRPSQEGESFEALDGKTYVLDKDMTVIGDDSGIISLGGIMGGEGTGCTEATQTVFLECAFFEAAQVARTGQALGILSDARFRFERGVDPLSTLPGLEAATRMILELCGGEASEVIEVGAVPPPRKPISFRSERVYSLGGLEVTPKRADACLMALGFEVKGSEVTPPSWRSDIDGEADLVEEVLRLEGYEKIPSASCDVRPEPQPLDPLQERRFVIRDLLAGRGLVETMTWSFMAESEAQLFGGVPESLVLMNPISQDLKAMRPSLLPHLLKAALFNQNRGAEGVHVFEVGPQYTSPELNGQEIMASGLRAGAFPNNWMQKRRVVDFFDVKADVMAILGPRVQWEAPGPVWYHPGRSAILKLGPMTLGYCGELHPRVVKTFDVKGPVVAFELFIDKIPVPKRTTTAKVPLALSPYQAVERDFAFSVDAGLPAADLIQLIEKIDKNLVEEIKLFDVFELGEGKKSLGVRVRLQSKIHTLSDQEIQEFSDKVIKTVAEKLKGTLREAGGQ